MRIQNSTKLNLGFVQDERGATAVTFALMAVPLFAMVGIALDYSRAASQQSNMQSAIDAAVLAAVKSTSSDKIAVARTYFNANFDSRVAPATTRFSVDSNGAISGIATSIVPMPFASLAQLTSVNVEIDTTGAPPAGGHNAEVAMMIDLTGSMGQTRNGTKKIDGLVSAGNDLLNILFPNGAASSASVKIGIAPMADYVNAGPYAVTATGLSPTGSYAKSTNLTQTLQGLFSGTYSGLTSNLAGSQFGALSAAVSSAGTTFSNTFCTGGTEILTYKGLPVGTEVDSHANGAVYSLVGFYKLKSNLNYEYSDNHWYKPTRSSNCTEAADQSGRLITCVTERTGSNAYTDESPLTGGSVGAYNQAASGSTNKLNYSQDGKCYVAGRELPAVIPLTNVKSTLKSFFDGPSGAGPAIGGGTPGHLGHAWAWYLLSPNWSSIWPSSSKPVDYTVTTTKKYAIIMTDGEYNEQYSSATSKTQALNLCTAMKAKGITVYTVGFGFDSSAIGANTTDGQAKKLLSDCASPNGYFFPYDGAALRTAFSTIGQAISGGLTTGGSEATLSN